MPVFNIERKDFKTLVGIVLEREEKIKTIMAQLENGMKFGVEGLEYDRMVFDASKPTICHVCSAKPAKIKIVKFDTLRDGWTNLTYGICLDDFIAFDVENRIKKVLSNRQFFADVDLMPVKFREFL